MLQNKKGCTLFFENRPAIVSAAAVVGKMEGEGPLGEHFDEVYADALLGQKSWEKAENMLQKNAANLALKKGGIASTQLDFIFAGDLLNQCVGSSFGLKNMSVPYVGLYGACSTMALSSALASLFVDRSAADYALAVTSSHFSSAERQFRYPLSYGGQRTPTSQWTVTGSGALVWGRRENGPKAVSATFGRIVDMGINDINNMGAAMAPAAADTLLNYFADSGKSPKDFDLILTGDLGYIGSELLIELMLKEGIDISKEHNDCGRMIFNRQKQDVHAGGSGCGCSASVLCGYIVPLMQQKKLNNLLFCATGALMSPVTDQQGETIPSIAHLLHIASS